ncbi:hypothetical protein GCAAIG_04055 [Candidatus Electronema halotolerans]|jgi:hypothetical protein
MNPYKVLDLSAEAEAKNIIAAAAKAMREKKYSVREIAEARRQLMNPKLRPLLDFICFADVEPLLRPADPPAESCSPDELERLDIFD